ncbi:MAG: hypothetical protein ABIB79_01190 [archaeon]
MRKRLSKKGISIMIGYVLLISFAVIIGSLVYVWMKSYLPKDLPDCPDDTSIFIKDLTCKNVSGEYVLDITFKNNGRFDVTGYYIKATQSENQKVATLDIAPNLSSEGLGTFVGDVILFSTPPSIKGLEPNDEKTHLFNLSTNIYSIEILPFIDNTYDNRISRTGCTTAKLKEYVDCVN